MHYESNLSPCLDSLQGLVGAATRRARVSGDRSKPRAAEEAARARRGRQAAASRRQLPLDEVQPEEGAPRLALPAGPGNHSPSFSLTLSGFLSPK